MRTRQDMQRILSSIISISLGISIPIIASADTYDDFMKTKIAEFQSTPSDIRKCKHKKIATSTGDFTKIYDLCLLQGKPVTLYVYTDGAALDISDYRNGKLVQIALSEFGDGVGFHNGQPVVEWHAGEYGRRGVNWKITAQDQASYLASAAEQRKTLLKLFGVRSR
jgi:hypothetical protein